LPVAAAVVMARQANTQVAVVVLVDFDHQSQTLAAAAL
jgi:hypothetical protein